jgi:hypothetical protein
LPSPRPEYIPFHFPQQKLILQDIVDFTEGQIGEIKPLFLYGLTTGPAQLWAAIKIANGFTVSYRGHSITIPPIPHGRSPAPWEPEDWQPGIQILFPGTVNPRYANWVAVTLGNIDGLILYKAFKCPIPALACGAAYALADEIAKIVPDLLRDLRSGLDPAIELIYEYRLEAAITAVALTGAAAWYGGLYVGIETLRLQFHTKFAGFFTFGFSGLACAF